MYNDVTVITSGLNTDARKERNKKKRGQQIESIYRKLPVEISTSPLHLLTYLLTPWSRVLLQKLTGSAASQEIPRIFGNRRFLTLLTSARHLSLS